MLKHYETKIMHSYSWRAFQCYQECDEKNHDLGDLKYDIHTKQANLPSFLDRLSNG
jgi:hypothetical protein